MSQFPEHEPGKPKFTEIASGTACNATAIDHTATGGGLGELLKFDPRGHSLLRGEAFTDHLPPQFVTHRLKFLRQFFSSVIFYNGTRFRHSYRTL